MARFHQVVLIASVCLLAWLLMQAIHELGHVAAAWLTCGRVQRVVLHPLAISRTDVEPNPHPLLVAWGGPAVGAALPLVTYALTAAARWNWSWLARFFAGFCLLANGLYLGVGSFNAVGDAGDLLSHGAPLWSLWLFGLLTAPSGLALWNGLGRNFGFGAGALPVPSRVGYGCAACLAAAVIVEVLAS